MASKSRYQYGIFSLTMITVFAIVACVYIVMQLQNTQQPISGSLNLRQALTCGNSSDEYCKGIGVGNSCKVINGTCQVTNDSSINDITCNCVPNQTTSTSGSKSTSGSTSTATNSSSGSGGSNSSTTALACRDLRKTGPDTDADKVVQPGAGLTYQARFDNCTQLDSKLRLVIRKSGNILNPPSFIYPTQIQEGNLCRYVFHFDVPNVAADQYRLIMVRVNGQNSVIEEINTDACKLTLNIGAVPSSSSTSSATNTSSGSDSTNTSATSTTSLESTSSNTATQSTKGTTSSATVTGRQVTGSYNWWYVLILCIPLLLVVLWLAVRYYKQESGVSVSDVLRKFLKRIRK